MLQNIQPCVYIIILLFMLIIDTKYVFLYIGLFVYLLYGAVAQSGRLNVHFAHTIHWEKYIRYILRQ